MPFFCLGGLKACELGAEGGACRAAGSEVPWIRRKLGGLGIEEVQGTLLLLFW